MTGESVVFPSHLSTWDLLRTSTPVDGFATQPLRNSLSLSAFLKCDFSSLRQGQDMHHEGLLLKMTRGSGISISNGFTWDLPLMRMKKPTTLHNTDFEAHTVAVVGPRVCVIFLASFYMGLRYKRESLSRCKTPTSRPTLAFSCGSGCPRIASFHMDFRYERKSLPRYRNTEVEAHTRLMSVALQPYNPTTLLPYNPIALHPYTYNPTTLQPYNPTTLQPYNHTILQLYHLTTLQPYMTTTLNLQPYNPTILQAYNPTTLHPYNPATIQPYDPTTLHLQPYNHTPLRP